MPTAPASLPPITAVTFARSGHRHTAPDSSERPLIDIATSKRFRLINTAVAPTQALQRSPLELGPPMPTNLPNNGSISITSSNVELAPSGTLKTIQISPTGRSLPGDIVILSAAAGATVTVSDTAGNIRLGNSANVSLVGDNGDTLTLVCRGTYWAQVAISKN